MVHRYVLHNGSIREARELMLSPSQIGLLSGWGVFSTLRIMDGVLFAFGRHWTRISRDAALFHIAIPSDPEPLRRRLLDLVEANGAHNGAMRLAIVRNSGGLWEGPSNGRASDIVALTADAHDWGRGVRLACVPEGRHAACEFAGAKILSWATNLTWLENAKARGFDEALLLNERGEVAECTSANIFASNGSTVWTPPLSSGCLPGITREVLLEAVGVPGFEIEEKTLTLADLEAAEEVFVTSTTRELLPVLEIEGIAVNHGLRARDVLQKAFSDYVESYIASHKG